MKTQESIITNSRLITIIKCCIAAIFIASAISLPGKIDIEQFIHNLLDWECI